MKKKILSMLLVVVLVISMLPSVVIAEGEEHIHCLCGANLTKDTVCADCGSEAIVWTAWDGTTALKNLSAGNYYLTQDIEITAVQVISKDIAIDLCGHNITGNGNRAIYINGVTMSIVDCTDADDQIGKITGFANEGSNPAITIVKNGSNAGVLNIYGGKIVNNTSTTPGGGVISVSAGTTLNMYGGEISHNTVVRGAICGSATANPYTINIFGGVITGNTATGTDNLGGGAGVYSFSPVTVGGDAKVYGNTGMEGRNADIYLRNDGSFTGALILSGEKPLEQGAQIGYGLWTAETDAAALQMISGAPARWKNVWISYDGQKVGYADGVFFLDDGPADLDDGNYGEGGDVVVNDHIHCLCGKLMTEDETCTSCGSKAVAWTAWENKDALPTDGYYYLTETVTTATVNYKSANTCICLHGNDIVSKDGNRLIVVYKTASVSITDCGSQPGKITGCTKDQNGSTLRMEPGGVLNLYGGRVTGNASAGDGTIYAAVSNAEGIAGGEFNMYGGEISGNTARRGAIFAASGGIHAPVVRILGGTITGNHADGTGATSGGGGILSFYPVEIGGNAKVCGNTSTLAGAEDIYLRNDGTFAGALVVSVDKPLEAGAQIAYSLKIADDPENLQFISGAPAHWDSTWVTYDGKSVKYKDGIFTTKAEIVISGHDHGGHSWISVTEENGQLPQKDGYYVLDSDVQLPSSMIILKDNHVHLCLNGHTLTAAEGTMHFEVRAGAKLTICDCTAKTVDGVYTAGKLTGGSNNNGAAIRARAGSEFYLYDGIFCENSTSGSGGAICLDAASADYPGAIFVMYGGMLRDNVGGYGGAIRMGAPASADLTGPTFIMEGGTICNNESPNYGGAIHAAGGATIELRGGVIENNVATASGGAVSINGNTTLSLSGTVIRNNAAATYGGGVYIKTGAILQMTGGEISGNNARVGAGVMIESKDTTFHFADGKISDNTAGSGGGGGIYAANDTVFNMRGGEISNNGTEASGAGVILCGQTANLTGGKIIGNKSTGAGAGLWIQGSEVQLGKIQICDNVSSGSSGGGVYVSRCGSICSNVIMDGTVISNNKCDRSGGGMFVYMNGNTVTMKSGKITGNEGGNGGGVNVQRECTFTMESGEISDNTATASGGGFYANTDSTFIMNGGQICGNYAERAGGGLVVVCATSKLNNGSISNNYAAKGSGGGVYIAGSKVALNGTWITNNKAMEASGGGILLTAATVKANGVSTVYNSYLVINAGRVADNFTPKAGGGLLIQSKGTVVDMYGGKVTENTSTKFGAGIYVGSGSAFNMHGGQVSYNVSENDSGAGVYHQGGSGNYTGGEIFGNVSPGSGGGLLVTGKENVVSVKNLKIYDNSAKVGGGACVQSYGTLQMEDCEIYGNQSIREAAGVHIYRYSTYVAKNCHFYDNVTKGDGGGVWSVFDSYTTLENCLIENNQAVNGQGGGVWTRGDGCEIIGCTIRNNTAAGNGGGVFAGQMGTTAPGFTPGLTIENTVIENNISGGQGGGLYQSTVSRGYLKDVSILNNTAAAEAGAIWAKDEFTMHNVTAIGNTSGGKGYAVYLDDSDYDGHSYVAGQMKISGSMKIYDNPGGDMYLGEKTALVIGSEGIAEDSRIGITLHSGLLTQWVRGAYNYEGGDLNYTITYGNRSITDPEIPDAPVEEPLQPPCEMPTEGEAEQPKSNTGLLIGIGAVVAVIAAAAVVIVAAASKKKKAAK